MKIDDVRVSSSIRVKTLDTQVQENNFYSVKNSLETQLSSPKMISTILTLISLSSINALSHGQSSFVFLGHDFSIRLSEDWGYCIFKKGKGYNNGDEVWVKKCGSEEEDGLFSDNVLKAGKFQWSYNMESKQIESVGSVLNLDKFYCWTLADLDDTDYEYKQRVTIVECYSAFE